MKHISTLLLGFCFLLISAGLHAQNNVGIGVANPDPTSILEMQSTDKGVLIPRMTSVQRTAIVNPANGLLVYDTDSSCFFFFSTTSSVWFSMCGGGGGSGTVGPAGPAGATGATGPTGPTGPTGSGGGGPGGGSDNTSMAYDATTGVVSVTDGAGTVSTTITPPGRWSVIGNTDIQTSSTAWVAMNGTTLTFTPTKSKVFVTAAVSGDADMSGLSPLTPAVPVGGVGVRLKNASTNTIYAGASTIVNSPSYDFSLYQSLGLVTVGAVIGWNCSMSTEITVTPGTPITLVLEWQRVWTQAATFPVRCRSASDPDKISNRNIIVWE